MYFHDGIDIPTRANLLTHRLIDGHDPKYGVGSMTTSIYDTAWVSMVAKTEAGKTQWLYPSCFQYILDHQQHDGGWQYGPMDTDVVLNTLAALLAICIHIAQPRQWREGLEDMQQRKSRAIYFLETKFSNLSIDSTLSSLGPHDTVARHLQMLQKHGVDFTFNGKDSIMQTIRRRGSTTGHGTLFGLGDSSPSKTKAGETIFDRNSGQRLAGSVRGSPASTAAYLMECATWDDEAEAYLTHILSIGDSRSIGGVPSRFPTTTVEITGVLTTLLENGFAHKDFDSRTLEYTAMFLVDCLQLGSGVTGFASNAEPDAENTARAISALSSLGRNASPQGLIIRYETREYFKTYTQDRQPSFVTNCYVLKALLDLLSQNIEQMPQIEKAVRFLCNRWWTTNGRVQDRSNTSVNYPIMLMVIAFMRLIELWESGYVPVPDDLRMKDKVIISLFQALTRLLQSQKPDGSWGDGGCEITAYAIISLSKLFSLSSAPRVKLQTAQAIESGRRYLLENSKAFSEPDRVWKGTISSGNGALYQAYVLAALQTPIVQQQNEPTIESHFEIPLAKITIQTKYYARQAWLVNVPEWLIQASLTETHLFLPQIKDMRYAVFPSESLTNDKYFESIPFTWIVANNLNQLCIGAEFIHQMMILSVLDRQLEDYMDHTVRQTFAGCLFEVEDIIYGISYELEQEDPDRCFCDSPNCGPSRFSTATTFSDVRSVLYRFVAHVLNHPYVLMAGLKDQSQLRSELMSFMLSRVSRLGDEEDDRTTVDKTAHPYTYAFLACLVGDQSLGEGIGLRRDFLKTPEQQYLAADLCRHISIINFMSANTVRPQSAEATVASASSARSRSTSFGTSSHHRDFSRSISSASTASSVYDDSMSPVSSMSSAPSSPPALEGRHFFSKAPAHSFAQYPSTTAQESLQIDRILEHERRCLDLCLESLLDAGIDQKTNSVLRLFVDAAALSERIFHDPNIGTSCEETPIQTKSYHACILNPPPVPPKRERGSVSAARAAMIIEPSKVHQESQDLSVTSQNREEDYKKPSHTLEDQVSGPVSTGRDWSWNKKSSSFPTRRSSRAGSEISRIESIMSEIDGIRLDTDLKVTNNPSSQRQTASESDAFWTQPHTNANFSRRRLTNSPAGDAGTMKLAKARMETQQRLKYEAQKRTARGLQQKAMAEIVASQNKVSTSTPPSKSTDDSKKQEAKRKAPVLPENSGWVKAPPPLVSGTLEVQAKKLHRASKWGGPKWKAPF